MASVCLVLIFFYALRIADDFVPRGFLVEGWKVLQYNVCILAALTIFSFVIKNSFGLSRLTLMYFLLVNTALQYACHCAFKAISRYRHASGAFHDHCLLLVAPAAQLAASIETIRDVPDSPYSILGVVPLDPAPELTEVSGIPVVATPDTLLAYAAGHVVDEVVFLMQNGAASQDPRLIPLIADLELTGMAVSLRIDILDTGIPDVRRVDSFGDINVIRYSMREFDERLLFVKRLMDIAGGIVGIVLTVVLCVFLAPLILLESRGPLFFSQERVGRNGRVFRMYKFRSMYRDAEERKDELMDQNEMSGPIFKLKDDPRITRVGRFIRKTSLDEFPQFLNVLKGDMSLVGTRPPTVEEYQQYTHLQKRRLTLKPGLSGLWQISGRNDIENFEDVIAMDLAYIDNWSLRLDVKIILKTLVVMVTGKGR